MGPQDLGAAVRVDRVAGDLVGDPDVGPGDDPLGLALDLGLVVGRLLLAPFCTVLPAPVQVEGDSKDRRGRCDDRGTGGYAGNSAVTASR